MEIILEQLMRMQKLLDEQEVPSEGRQLATSEGVWDLDSNTFYTWEEYESISMRRPGTS